VELAVVTQEEEEEDSMTEVEPSHDVS